MSSFIFNELDLLRASLLRRTLTFPLFRGIFLTRAYRLFVFFLLSCGLNLFLAMKYPLWVLVAGPLLLGIPHLMASLRYVPLSCMSSQKQTSQLPLRKIYNILGIYFLIFIGGRLSFSWWGPGSFYALYLDLGGGFLAFYLLFYLCGWTQTNKTQITQKLIFGNIWLLLLGGAILFRPMMILGLLVLIHNFIPFFYWIDHCSRQQGRENNIETYFALLALFIFSLITAFILWGGADAFILTRAFAIFPESLNEMNDFAVGSQIFPRSSLIMWQRGVSAYAFGQSIHYFVWLKAIAETNLPHQYPLSFTQSFLRLKKDFGKFIIGFGIFFFLLLIGVYCITRFPQARILYLTGASYHGYIELVGVSFLKMGTKMKRL